MKCAILQPSYIPWRGYFEQIKKSDVFVFYDDVQYDKHGWRNRNRIKTANGSTWLTIPVHAKGNVSQGQKICETPVIWDGRWPKKHWLTIEQSYRAAPYFSRYEKFLRALYEPRPEFLADFTIALTIALARELGLTTRFVRSSELTVTGDRTERLIAILKEIGASHYISGPSARDYLQEPLFANAGIGLEYMIYEYPEYPQLHPPFDGQVSIIDLLFMCGPEAGRWLSSQTKVAT